MSPGREVRAWGPHHTALSSRASAQVFLKVPPGRSKCVWQVPLGRGGDVPFQDCLRGQSPAPKGAQGNSHAQKRPTGHLLGGPVFSRALYHRTPPKDWTLLHVFAVRLPSEISPF